MTNPDNTSNDAALQLRTKSLALLAHRARRLANVCVLPESYHPPPSIIGLFAEGVIDAAMAYAPEEVIAALVRRLARDAQIRAGVCIDCGKNPAVGDHGIILCEQCLQAEQQADRDIEQQAALERAQTGRPM